MENIYDEFDVSELNANKLENDKKNFPKFKNDENDEIKTLYNEIMEDLFLENLPERSF